MSLACDEYMLEEGPGTQGASSSAAGATDKEKKNDKEASEEKQNDKEASEEASAEDSLSPTSPVSKPQKKRKRKNRLAHLTAGVRRARRTSTMEKRRKL